MQNKDEKDLEAFFAAARDEAPELPEYARRRILIDAQRMQPTAPTKGLWRMPQIWPTMQVGAAFASLALGIFLGVSQPESITAITSLDGLISAQSESFEDDAIGGFGSMMIESSSL